MALQYKPFAACPLLVSVARGSPTLHAGHHGIAVRLIQGALLEVGFTLPSSIKKAGSPDGIFGRETEEVVKKFQGAGGLKPDGIVGKATLLAFDSYMKATSSPPSLPAPVPPPPPTSVDYMVGTSDPPVTPDPGAGVWNSSPTRPSYVALKAAILDVLPSSMVLVGDDAVAHMFHYLGNSGRSYTIDLAGMIDEVPSAKARYRQEVRQAQEFVQTLPPGAHSITSRRVEGGYNYQHENRNWFFATGGYVRWGTGRATVQDSGGEREYALDFVYKMYDRYNWDGGKSVTLFGITVTDQFMGEFHRQGLAREFDCWGSVRRAFRWKHGEIIDDAQLFAPATSERG